MGRGLGERTVALGSFSFSFSTADDFDFFADPDAFSPPFLFLGRVSPDKLRGLSIPVKLLRLAFSILASSGDLFIVLSAVFCEVDRKEFEASLRARSDDPSRPFEFELVVLSSPFKSRISCDGFWGAALDGTNADLALIAAGQIEPVSTSGRSRRTSSWISRGGKKEKAATDKRPKFNATSKAITWGW